MKTTPDLGLRYVERTDQISQYPETVSKPNAETLEALLLALLDATRSTGAREISSLIAAGGGDRTSGGVTVQRDGSTVQLMLNDVRLSTPAPTWKILLTLPPGFRPAAPSVKAQLVGTFTGEAVLIARRSDGGIFMNRQGPDVRHALTLVYLTADPWPTTLPGTPA